MRMSLTVPAIFLAAGIGYDIMMIWPQMSDAVCNQLTHRFEALFGQTQDLGFSPGSSSPAGLPRIPPRTEPGIASNASIYTPDLNSAFAQPTIINPFAGSFARFPVIAHPGYARTSGAVCDDSTKRMVSRTEALLALAVLTTERKAA